MESSKFVTKKSLWIAVVVIALPLFGIGAKVWSEQEADPLRYVNKTAFKACTNDISKLETSVVYIQKDLDTIKRNQLETQRDVKEILRHLRDKN